MRPNLTILMYTPILCLACASEIGDVEQPPDVPAGSGGTTLDSGTSTGGVWGGAAGTNSGGLGGSEEDAGDDPDADNGGAAGNESGGAAGENNGGAAGDDPGGTGGTGGTGAAGGKGGTGGFGGFGGFGGTGGTGGSGGVTGTCAPGKFLVGVANGKLVCTNLEAAVKDYVHDNCSLYWGWRDDCDGCQSQPQRWGRVSDSSCLHNGWGLNTCSTATLANESVRLFGLNPGGDVDGNDKLYVGLRCTAPSSSVTGQCPAGQFATGIAASGKVICGSVTTAARDTINESCRLYAGVQDDCMSTSCVTPSKWGRVTGDACIASGTNDTCTAPTLGGKAVRLLGLNPDGDVDHTDKLFMGMKCDTADSSVAGDCPTGQLAVGISGGKVECASVAGVLSSYIADKCSIYMGWKDDCNGCTSPPAKWGKVSQNSCSNGAGSDNTCTTALLNGSVVKLFGLNPDGDVDGNDKLYYGFRCE